MMVLGDILMLAIVSKNEFALVIAAMMQVIEHHMKTGEIGNISNNSLVYKNVFASDAIIKRKKYIILRGQNGNMLKKEIVCSQGNVFDVLKPIQEQNINIETKNIIPTYTHVKFMNCANVVVTKMI